MLHKAVSWLPNKSAGQTESLLIKVVYSSVMSNPESNNSNNCVRGFRLFNNAGRFVFQRPENNQRLIGLIMGQIPDLPQHIELPQVNVIPRTSIIDDVSLARRRHAQYVASLRHSETVNQVNNRNQSDSVRQAASRSAECNEQTANRRARDDERHTIARQAHNDQATNRRARDATRQTIARQRQNVSQVANRRRANAQRNVAVRARRNAPYYNVARQHVLPNVYYLGVMDKNCQVIKFENEECFKCCHNGKVALDNLSPYPEQLRQLLTNNDTAQARNFQMNIRKYNSAVSFASFGANLRPPPGRGPPCFRICSQIWHRVGDLHPPEGQTPVFNQLYIYEAGRALNERMARPENNGCREDVMQTVQDIMNRVSPFAAAYRYMAEVEADEIAQAAAENRVPSEVRMCMRVGSDRRRYNLPHHDEVAAVFVGQDGAPPGNRDIVTYPRAGNLRNIFTVSANLEPMVYPLFFPRGEPDWYYGIPHVAKRATRTRNTTTMLQYYTYRYCVDSYVKVEGNNLNYIRANQTNLRVDSYEGSADHLNARAEERDLQPGRIVVLPSSFQGSPRAMAPNYQDAMAVIGKFGKPDFFLTFTCNPKWREITENLFAGQRAHDRPDLVSRVFKLKLNELLKDVTERGVLGKTVSHVYVIEFQKRGLPHCHLLLHLDPNDKLRDADDIDSVISAEIPNQQEQPELFEIIRSCMIHGPCGYLNPNSRCMEDGVCTKNFPKNFLGSTVADVDGYPLYRRRNNGIHINVNNVDVDNRWVVPYNPWLSKKYNAHINLEACMSVKSVKYLYKYIYKGHDCANIEINERIIDHDEVQTFLDARYVSAPEAIWRLFEFKMHQQSHVVHRLPVHLPNNHIVHFQPDQVEEAVNRAANQATKLTAWFVLNGENHNARQYLYPDIPLHFVFNNDRKAWTPRRNFNLKIVSRMYSVSPRAGELFYLRMLLLHTCGAKSYEDLRTVDGNVAETFRETCLLGGLLQDDTEWNNTLEEAVNFQMPRQLRQLFAIILIHCEPSDPFTLWTRYKGSMCEDYPRQMNEDQAEYRVLQDIYSVLRQSGKSLTDFNLPSLDEIPPAENIDVALEAGRASQLRAQLTEEQTALADAVIEAVVNVANNTAQNNRLFYLEGAGGSGKTFTYNYLISKISGRGFQVGTAAFTGIAATLLKNGTTIHKLLRLPVPILENSTCSITPVSAYAAELRQKNLFLLDESSMIPKHAFHAIDRLLRDICNSELPFGGKVVLLGGDFSQLLPVVRKGNPTEIVDMCLKSSPPWHLVTEFKLTHNMRTRPGEQEFAAWLLQLGKGVLPVREQPPFQGAIEVPSNCVLQQNQCIVNTLFRDFHPENMASSVILTPTNDDSLIINDQVLELLPGMPPHCLKLKSGAIVMLLRNININKGLCNGTRLIVRYLHDNCVDAEVLTGNAIGDRVLIPRVQLAPPDTGMPLVLRRRQLPLRLSIAMTINKAQGQTLKRARAFDDVRVMLSE
ncbi:uncharacterized protein LOC130613606 [Hydractinia symbiolongicarpus]|uniref:uncharacterized protein LOC130613606 n=1 Tax=Hydractinia symbiolongicarpus TaxID=13093 RepID=UPI002549EC5E|nr:uncharacterized protein LOC130613606 [Hydractinia symbiolongicarpus]